MRGSRAVLLSLALAAGVLGMVVMLRGGVDLKEEPSSMEAREKASVTVKRRMSPDVVLNIVPGAPSSRAPAKPAPATALMQEFRESRAHKAIFDRLNAATQRSAEEDFVLAEILSRCARITDRKQARPPRSASDREQERAKFVATISEKDPARVARIAAYDQLMSNPCAGIEAEATEGRLRELLERSAAAGDPKARARLVEKDLWAQLAAKEERVAGTPMTRGPEISDAQLEALKQAAQSNDLQAFQIAGRVFGTTLANLTLRAGPEEARVDPRLFTDAWNMVACDLGANCGADSSRLQVACAHEGTCGAQDFREYLFFAAHSPQQSQRVNDYYTHLLAAARNGDWSYFTFHRGPPPPYYMSILMQR